MEKKLFVFKRVNGVDDAVVAAGNAAEAAGILCSAFKGTNNIITFPEEVKSNAVLCSSAYDAFNFKK